MSKEDKIIIKNKESFALDEILDLVEKRRYKKKIERGDKNERDKSK